MNIIKFITKLSCLIFFAGLIIASDNPGAGKPASDNFGNFDGRSMESSFSVVGEDGNGSDSSDEAPASGNVSGDERVSGESSTTGSSDDLSGRRSADSDDSDDVVFDAAEKFWNWIVKKIKKYPNTTAIGVGTVVFGAVYKFHKPFRIKVNAVRDKVRKPISEFWQRQKQEPLTVGCVAKSTLAGAILYGAYKARLFATLATPFKRAGNYLSTLDFSQKCVLTLGVGCTAVAASWAYQKFSQKSESSDSKPAISAANK